MQKHLDKSWLQQILDAMTEHVVVLDAGGRIVMVNDAWKRFSCQNGGPDLSWEGVDYFETCKEAMRSAGDVAEQSRAVLVGLDAVLGGRLDHFQIEYPCHSPQRLRWFVMNATPLTEGPCGAVITHAEVTERKLREMEILQQAHRDPLTGLANRRLFEARAEELLTSIEENCSSAAVLLLDLDRFKPVNDTFGHQAGDKILRQVAARLSAMTHSSGLVARLGGDEFGVLVPGVRAKEAEALADRILTALGRPFYLKGRELRLGASLGLSLYPMDGDCLTDLLEAADTAMYQAKAAGGGLRLAGPPEIRLAAS
ncbi:MAG TPA: sensor domain-containing diguanylate cyclase [Thermoanaerobaculia bacterium]|nr:sensor domain-containing diguanylate cyclase [Thermoanaerobaculia bacterium]